MKRTVWSIVCVCVLVLLFSCKSTGIKGIDEDGVMHAMIYDYDNNGVRGVSVYIDGSYMGESDVRGRFMFKLHDAKEHELVLQKDGWERVSDTIVFDTMLVLYYKMGNAAQLINLAEDALDAGTMDEALMLLDRALGLGGGDDARYLKSVVLFKAGKYDEALETLSQIEEKEETASYIQDFKQKIISAGGIYGTPQKD
ncbi:tetratricopeptide repeat protein [Treponema socranskii]|uniref:tetratricopeptide repeat protein n=1 Tax=Treponema socranskii TaxID=53419 RepID=UPI003D9256F3